MSLRSSTYTVVAQKILELRNLRKVKLFPSLGSVTIITYYKCEANDKDYTGHAHLINVPTFTIMHIELAHTSHLPPPATALQGSEEEVEIEEESDPAPPPEPTPFPAIGAHLRNYSLPALYTTNSPY